MGTGTWSNNRDLKQGLRYKYRSEIVGRRLYCVGGVDDWDRAPDAPKTLTSVTDLVTKESRSVTSMLEARDGHCMVEIGGKLVVAGGLNLKSCEIYSPDRDVWERLPDMTECRWGAGCA